VDNQTLTYITVVRYDYGKAAVCGYKCDVDTTTYCNVSYSLIHKIVTCSRSHEPTTGNPHKHPSVCVRDSRCSLVLLM